MACSLAETYVLQISLICQVVMLTICLLLNALGFLAARKTLAVANPHKYVR
jgi:hypothetical protein